MLEIIDTSTGEVKPMNLQQKLIEIRKAVPKISKEKHSANVTYKYAKIDNIWEMITPVMNVLGVNFAIIKEEIIRRGEHGLEPWVETSMKNGRQMFVYDAGLTVRWTDADNPDDVEESVLHATAWNDDPAKAKGSAWTYCLKYYLLERFGIDCGEDDPDNGQPNGQQGNAPRPPKAGSGKLSESQLDRMYLKGKAAGFPKEKVDASIKKNYGKDDPSALTKAQYEEVCKKLDAAAPQEPKGVTPDVQ